MKRKGEEQKESDNERETNKPPYVFITVKKDYTGAREAKLKAKVSTDETPQSRKRKRINEQVMDHETEYVDKKMKLSRKKQRS